MNKYPKSRRPERPEYLFYAHTLPADPVAGLFLDRRHHTGGPLRCTSTSGESLKWCRDIGPRHASNRSPVLRRKASKNSLFKVRRRVYRSRPTAGCDRAGARSDLPEGEKGRSIAGAILFLCSREHLSRGPNGRLRVYRVEVSYLEVLGQSRASVRDVKRRQYALTRTRSLFLRMLYYGVKTCRSFGRALLCFVHHIAYLPIRSSGIGNSRASLVNS